MKKLIILLIVVLLQLVSISCKRNHICRCGPAYNEDGTGWLFVINDTKARAVKKCHNTPNPRGDISVAPYCEIK